MIGIYKITNKINGKSYIGQSIHCGKRFDEHYKGNQLIDETIQIEGIENFTFEILKEVNQSELSIWEDYYIHQYNTMYPNGYNKKWNCSEELRKTFILNNKTEKVEDSFQTKLDDIIILDSDIKLLKLAAQQQSQNFIRNRIYNINQFKEYLVQGQELLNDCPVLEGVINRNTNDTTTYAQSNILRKIEKYIQQYNNKFVIQSISGRDFIENYFEEIKNESLDRIKRASGCKEFGIPIYTDIFQKDGIHLFYPISNSQGLQPYQGLIRKKVLNSNKVDFIIGQRKVDILQLERKEAKKIREIHIHN